MKNWELLTHPVNNEIRQVMHIQHLAAQFLALTGRYLIPEIEDQDNITMKFVSEEEMFVGRQHPDGWLISLKLRNLTLQIRDNNMSVINEIHLEGRTFPEVLLEFKRKLQETGTDVTLLRTEQPYDLPFGQLKEGLFFITGPEDSLNENIKYRHNANILLNNIREGYKGTSPVYIWPNHFDTGFSFPVEHNKSGEISKTIGMGWAIPDDMVDEPYYYLSLHAQEKLNSENKPDDLPDGKWMMPGWNGAVLTLSEMVKIQEPEKQMEMVRSFLETGVKRLTEHYKISQ